MTSWHLRKASRRIVELAAAGPLGLKERAGSRERVRLPEVKWRGRGQRKVRGDSARAGKE